MEGQYFRIYKPYGMKRNAKGYWEFFNREYMPLGYNHSEECPVERLDTLIADCISIAI